MAKISKPFMCALKRHIIPYQYRNITSEGIEAKKPPLMNIENKVALITGGTTGIGLGIANELLSQKAKAVVLLGQNEKQGNEVMQKLTKEHGEGKCSFMEVDITKLRTYDVATNKVVDCFDSLDIFVNNAAILHDKEWEDEINVNVNCAAYGSIVAYRIMKKNPKGGIILNIADIYGLEPLAYAPVYCASKFAMIGMTKSFGHSDHYKDSKIRTVALCPGVTDTCMFSQKNQMLNEEWTDKLYQQLESKKPQPVVAVAKAALYLIKHAESGSVWPVEKSILYKANIPDLKIIRKKILSVY